jgi:sugar lactone lactonase YvrE
MILANPQVYASLQGQTYHPASANGPTGGSVIRILLTDMLRNEMNSVAKELVACTTESAELGEGARWIADAGELLWVDILTGVVHKSRWNRRILEAVSRWTLPRPVGAVSPAAGGGLLLATGCGFSYLDQAGTEAWHLQVEPGAEHTLRMNDGACDPAGRFFAGTVAYDSTPEAGSLWCLGLDGAVRLILQDLTISNGLAWSPDGLTFYCTDSGPGTIDAFAFAPTDGTVSRRRELIRVHPRDGTPDGLCVDDSGCLWVAIWGGSEIRRYSPDGQLMMRLELPVTQPTSLCFGGPERNQIFVTSATYGLTEKDRRREPEAGRIFTAQLNVSGPACNPYRGPTERPTQVQEL